MSHLISVIDPFFVSRLTILSLMSKIHEFRSLGHIKPLPLLTYNIAEIDKAFSTFSKGNHIGKIILSYEDEPGMAIKVSTDILVVTRSDPKTHRLTIVVPETHLSRFI